MLENAKLLYLKHSKWVPVVSFLVGFLFDILTLTRIDDLFTLVQQGIYLVLIGTLIAYDFLEQNGKFHPGEGRFARLWQYREAAIHFMFGSLMNAYALFYFKSASVVTSVVYVGSLVVILMVVEFKRFGAAKAIVHMAMWSLCLISFTLYLVPVALGFIGLVPFGIAVLLSGLISWWVYARLRKASYDQPTIVKKRVLVPFASVHFLFIALYFFELIPPVPLSISFIGIYHGIKKEGDKYLLTYTDPTWKFWRKDDRPFQARPNDKIYCFARIFSPARFSDELRVQWLYRDKAGGWTRSDSVPLTITGGRDEGFRGYTVKSNYSPGDWRCQIETTDHREIGRVTFHVEKDEETGERMEKVNVQ